MRTRLIGLPGTGKTTKLLKYLDQILLDYDPSEIVYCSYSNAAVNEAKDRVVNKFGFDLNELPYFRTIHSLCLRLLRENGYTIGARPATIADFSTFLMEYQLTHPDLLNFLEDVGIEVSTTAYISPEEKDDPLSMFTLWSEPHKFFLSFYSYCKSRYGCTPSQPQEFMKVKDQVMHRLDFKSYYENILLAQIYVVEKSWIRYKNKMEIFEFIDLLSITHQERLAPPAKVLIVDEFQDSSFLQSTLVENWAQEMDHTIVAGDPNQAIYGFQGASPSYLEDFLYDENILLHQSWRIPEVVAEFARKIIVNEWTKHLTSAGKKEGLVSQLEFGEVPWDSYPSVFVLGRTRTILKSAEEKLQKLGFICGSTSEVVRLLYRAYYELKSCQIKVGTLVQLEKTGWSKEVSIFSQKSRDLLRKLDADKMHDKVLSTPDALILMGLTDLSELRTEFSRKLHNLDDRGLFNKLVVDGHPPVGATEKIQLLTMHASKGKEADLVVILVNASYYEREDRVDVEEERRVYFVAATRAKKHLVLTSIEDESYEPTMFLPSIPLSPN